MNPNETKLGILLIELKPEVDHFLIPTLYFLSNFESLIPKFKENTCIFM